MRNRRRSTTASRADRGLTLVEMLVALVLVSLLGTLLIQGTGLFLDRFEKVKRVHREASLDVLRSDWFASTVAAILPSRQEARRFSGDSVFFQGVTLQPLVANAGRPTRIRWFIDSGSVFYTEQGSQPWTILDGQHGPLTFQYAGASGTWRERWPASGGHELIPRLVRLLSADGQTRWLARFDLYPRPVPNYREEF